MFLPTNIEEKLQQHKSHSELNKLFVDELLHKVKEGAKAESIILENLGDDNDGSSNNFNFDLLETDRIYHINTIKEICIDYRLRFLDSKYFKNEFPSEAFEKINALQQEHNIEIKNFKVMAPSKLFRLENPDDPLLFSPLGNGYYYLIHKWGNDLSPFRKLLVKPFKTLETLLFSAFIVSILVTWFSAAFLPSLSPEANGKTFILFLFNFKFVIAVMMFYAIPRGKNVNESIWDSPYSR